ncbi:MAG: NUDIX hydrolase [Acidobacteria bacterium]|nr:NUDIX hydrolase [Acidobacteriota bacterium]
MRQMIRIDQGNKRFNYRVVGIAINNGSVFIHKAEFDNFWTFPGGRAEIGETAEQTLKREFKEELNIDIKISRLLWFVENFFTYVDMDYHEVALYFLIELPSNSKYVLEPGPFLAEDEGTKLIFKWVKNEPDILSSLPLFPAFLQTSIQDLPKSIEHVVYRR